MCAQGRVSLTLSDVLERKSSPLDLLPELPEGASVHAAGRIWAFSPEAEP